MSFRCLQYTSFLATLGVVSPPMQYDAWGIHRPDVCPSQAPTLTPQNYRCTAHSNTAATFLEDKMEPHKSRRIVEHLPEDAWWSSFWQLLPMTQRQGTQPPFHNLQQLSLHT